MQDWMSKITMPQHELSDEDYKFIEKELGRSRSEVEALDKDGWIKLYNEILEIELAETPDSGGELSERGAAAINLVDTIWNPGDTPEGVAEWESDMSEDGGHAS